MMSFEPYDILIITFFAYKVNKNINKYEPFQRADTVKMSASFYCPVIKFSMIAPFFLFYIFLEIFFINPILTTDHYTLNQTAL